MTSGCIRGWIQRRIHRENERNWQKNEGQKQGVSICGRLPADDKGQLAFGGAFATAVLEVADEFLLRPCDEYAARCLVAEVPP